MFITNPTLVDAVWKLVHISTSPPRRRSIIASWVDTEIFKLKDDPTVFSFSEEQGVQKGPSLPLQSSAAALPEDFNRM